MKRTVLLLLILFSNTIILQAQNNKCDTDKMVQQELLLHPEKAIVLEQLELFTKEFIQNNNEKRLSDTTFIIPVVVHVIHDYGDERISLTQVQSAINSMNDDFNLRNDDLVNIDGEFIPSVANNTDIVNISFNNNNEQTNN